MQETEIGWATDSWNPVHGCTRVSEGCANCYAARISREQGITEKPWEPENAEDVVLVQDHKLEEPYGVDDPAHIFVNSMGDLFHSQIPDGYIQQCFDVMRETPRHVYQILTKRPGRAAQMDIEWPPNVWMGTSVEGANVTERLELLRPCNADVLFVSFEPLLGPVGDVNLNGYDWAIVGGESGPEYRDMDHEWARDILDQCRDQDVDFFFKQSSDRYPEQGKQLTVYNEDYGVYEDRRIQEMPDPHPAVQAVRKSP